MRALLVLAAFLVLPTMAQATGVADYGGAGSWYVRDAALPMGAHTDVAGHQATLGKAPAQHVPSARIPMKRAHVMLVEQDAGPAGIGVGQRGVVDTTRAETLRAGARLDLRELGAPVSLDLYAAGDDLVSATASGVALRRASAPGWSAAGRAPADSALPPAHPRSTPPPAHAPSPATPTESPLIFHALAPAPAPLAPQAVTTVVAPAPTVAVAAKIATALAPILLWTLYHRLRGERALQQATRARLHAMLQDAPGLSVAEAARALQVDPKTAQYHLQRLVKEGYAVVEGAPRAWRYFAAGAQPPASRAALVAQRAAPHVVAALTEAPGLTKSELARRLGTPRPTLAWHLERLHRAGVVRYERAGRSVRVHLAG